MVVVAAEVSGSADVILGIRPYAQYQNIQHNYITIIAFPDTFLFNPRSLDAPDRMARRQEGGVPDSLAALRVVQCFKTFNLTHGCVVDASSSGAKRGPTA